MPANAPKDPLHNAISRQLCADPVSEIVPISPTLPGLAGAPGEIRAMRT